MIFSDLTFWNMTLFALDLYMVTFTWTLFGMFCIAFLRFLIKE